MNQRESQAKPWDEVVELVLQAADSDPTNDGYIVQLPDRWGGASASELTLSTFNCCAYAVGDLLNLNQADWIDTRRRHKNEPDPPIQIILASYFDEVMRWPAKSTQLQAIGLSPVLQDGDLLCFGLTYGKRFDCVHIGKAKKIDDSWWMESKLGPGPVVVGTIAGTAAAYTGQYDVILAFRPKD